jgi:small-conductance mechanosensitive channel
MMRARRKFDGVTTRRRRAAWTAAALALWSSLAVAEPASPTPAASRPPTPSAPSAKSGAPVRVHDETIFVIIAKSGAASAEERAKESTAALKEAIKNTTPDDVRVERRGDGAVVYAGPTPIVTVTPEDARLAGDATIDDRAASIASRVRDALRTEQKRSAIVTTVFSLSLVVLLGLVTLYLVRKAGELARRGREWIANNPERIPAIRLKSIDVVRPSAIRSAIDLTLLVGRWVLQIGLVYTWLVIALSMFESTRAYTERLTGFVLAPLSHLAERIAGSLPLMLVAALGGVVVVILVRFAAAFFDSVARGQTHAAWLPRELARPTSVVVRVGIVVIALVFAAPLITGDADGALARIGTITLVVLGLALTPLAACAFVGASVVYLRNVREGEIVEFGGRSGRVLEVGLFELKLQDAEGCEVRVPHLLSLVHATRIIGFAPRVTIEVGVVAGAPILDLRERLLSAASALGTGPAVEVVGTDDDAVRWRVSVTSAEADARTWLYAAVLAALKDAKVGLKRVRADAA